MNAHDRKRAERFAQAGITVEDIASAEISYHGEGSASCTLCDHTIVHCYRLTFPKAIFEPVGSQCITDWVRALPESPARDAALAKVKDAEKEMRRLQTEAKDHENFLEALGSDARLWTRYLDVPEAARCDTLRDIAAQVKGRWGFVSGKQAAFFAVRLREAEARAARNGGAPVPAQARAQTPPAAPVPQDGPPTIDMAIAQLEADRDQDGARLMRRYAATVPETRCSTLTDMAERVIRYGRFSSDSQRRFFAVRLRVAESAPSAADAGQTVVGQRDMFAGEGDEAPVAMNPTDEGPDDYPY